MSFATRRDTFIPSPHFTPSYLIGVYEYRRPRRVSDLYRHNGVCCAPTLQTVGRCRCAVFKLRGTSGDLQPSRPTLFVPAQKNRNTSCASVAHRLYGLLQLTICVRTWTDIRKLTNMPRPRIAPDYHLNETPCSSRTTTSRHLRQPYVHPPDAGARSDSPGRLADRGTINRLSDGELGTTLQEIKLCSMYRRSILREYGWKKRRCTKGNGHQAEVLAPYLGLCRRKWRNCTLPTGKCRGGPDQSLSIQTVRCSCSRCMGQPSMGENMMSPIRSGPADLQ